MKRKFCISLDQDLVDRLDKARNRIPRSTMINELVDKGLEQIDA